MVACLLRPLGQLMLKRWLCTRLPMLLRSRLLIAGGDPTMKKWH